MGGNNIGLATITEHKRAVSCILFDGKNRFFTAAWDGTVKIWNAHSYTMLHSLSFPAPVTSLELYDDFILFIGGHEGVLQIHEVKEGQPPKKHLSLPIGSTINEIKLSKDNKFFAVAGWDVNTRIFPLKITDSVMESTTPAACQGHLEAVTSFVWLPSEGSREFVTGGYDSTLKRYELPTDTPILPAIIKPKESIRTKKSVMAVELLKDSQAVVALKTSVEIWEFAGTLQCLREIAGNFSQIESVFIASPTHFSLADKSICIQIELDEQNGTLKSMKRKSSATKVWSLTQDRQGTRMARGLQSGEIMISYKIHPILFVRKTSEAKLVKSLGHNVFRELLQF